MLGNIFSKTTSDENEIIGMGKQCVSKHSSYQRRLLINFAQISDCSTAAFLDLSTKMENKTKSMFLGWYRRCWSLCIFTVNEPDVLYRLQLR